MGFKLGTEDALGVAVETGVEGGGGAAMGVAVTSTGAGVETGLGVTGDAMEDVLLDKTLGARVGPFDP